MGRSQDQLSYQVNPIMLTGGSFSQTSDGMIPMSSLISGTQSQGGQGLGLPVDNTHLDNSFAAFNVLPGGLLINQSIAKYPFANQQVAANATIQEPLTISVIMDTPMRGPNAFQKKMSTFTKLRETLHKHNLAGGTYTVVTPAFQYENLILLSLSDNSRGNNSLPQNAWRFDFEKPLVSTTDAQGAQSQQLQKISNQVPTTGAATGIKPGQSAGNTNLSKTFKAVGGMTGGTMQILTNRFTFEVSNYPALPTPASFPFSGIS